MHHGRGPRSFVGRELHGFATQLCIRVEFDPELRVGQQFLEQIIRPAITGVDLRGGDKASDSLGELILAFQRDA